MAKKTTTRSLSILAALAMTTATFAAAPTALAAAPTSAQEAAMVPTPLTRIVDSRDAKGVDATPENNKTIDIKVAGNLNGDDDETEGAEVVVPADADAVVVNLTAVDASEAGFFTAWPKGGTRPATSNINFMVGDTIANGATIPVGKDGSISMFTRGSADVLVDIAGYYREDTYVDLADTSATRLYDSRLMPDGAIEDRSVTLINTGAMEGDILTLNITADQAKGDGYATVWGTQETPSTDEKPSLLGMPLTSNLNYAEGQTIANTVQVKAGKGGYVSIYTMTSTNLIVDQVAKIDDWDDADDDQNIDAGEWDAQWAYKAVQLEKKAQRVMDTRIALGSDMKEGYRALDFKNLVGADLDDLGSIVLNVTVDNAEADGFVSIGANLEEMGIDTSVLNFKAGQIIANRVVIPASFMGDLEVYSNVPTDIIVDVMGYTQAADVTSMDAKVLDLSEVEGETVYKAGAVDYNLGADTAIAIPNELPTDNENELIDDGDSATQWVPAGNSVSIEDADGNKSSISLISAYGTTVTDEAAKLVPLSGLTPGEYTMTVPIKLDGSNPVVSAKFESKFTVAPKGETLGSALTTATSVTLAATSPSVGEDTFTVDGDDFTVVTTATANLAAAGAEVASQLNGAFAAADVDDTYAAVVDASGASLMITKVGGTSPSVEVAEGTGSDATGITYTAITPNASTSPSSAAAAVAPAVKSAGYTSALPKLTKATASDGVTTFEASEAVSLIAPQELAVKLPAAFGSVDTVKWENGDDDSVTTSAPAGSGDYAGHYMVVLPSREALKGEDMLGDDLELTLSDTTAPLNDMKIDVIIK